MEEFNRLQLELIEKLNKKEVARGDAQNTVEGFWMGGLRKAVVDGDTDTGSVMAGQSVGLVSEVMPMGAIFEELINAAESELDKAAARLSD